MKNLLAFSALAALLALSGCQSKKDEPSGLELFPASTEGKVVAEFDGVTITDQYIQSFLKELPPRVKARYNTPEKREGLIMRIVEGEMLARAAMKEGATNDPALLTQIKATIAQYYTRKVLGARVGEKTKITEEEMREYYEKNKKRYDQPAKRRASHILVKVSQKAPKEEQEKALTKAREILEEVKKESGSAGSFARLAKKYSEDKGSKRKGGDVGYFVRIEDGGRMIKAFTEAAFSLSKIGDVSDVVQSKFGYHIIKFTGKRDAVSKSYDEVKRRIEAALKGMKRKSAFQSVIEDVKRKMEFQVYKEAMAAIDFGVPKSTRERRNPISLK